LEGLVDQHTQNLVLRFPRHVGDFVDKHAAAIGFLERADLARLRAIGVIDAENSTSMRSGVIAAALMTTNGDSARADSRCNVRAASSLPAPEGPTIRMRLLVGATLSMIWRI